MTALFPVVTRELQSAARRRGIYRSRYLAGICALVGGAIALFWAAYLPGKIPPGLVLFWFLSAVATLLCFAGGFLLTCDSISREKREGTLGLLFLTSLGLHEIVLGKMAAAIVFGASGVLALIPILALSVCLGGVTGPQFWSMALALLNLLLFSLSLGLFASACARRESSGGVIFILVMLRWLLFGFTFVFRSGYTFFPAFLFWHPLYPVLEAARVIPPALAGHYWPTVNANLVGSFLLLYSACVGTKIAFLRSAGNSIRKNPFTHLAVRKRKQKVGNTPILWLEGLDQNKEGFFWTLCASILGVVLLAGFKENQVVQLALLFAIHYLLVLLFAWKGCNLMSGLKKNGIIEILLTTPIRLGEVLAGQQAALQDFFFKPRVLVLILHGFYIVPAFARDPLANDVALGLLSLLLFLIESYSFIWIGFWQGWKARSTYFAFFRVVMIQILAWVPLLLIISLIFFLAAAPIALPPMRVFLCGVVSATIINLGFGMYGLFRLSSSFRKSVSG